MTPIERARELLKSDRLHGTVVMSGLDAAAICRALIAAEERVAELERALGDFADHGLRADLTPTMFFNGDDKTMYTAMCTYLRDLDAGLRRAARAALAEGKHEA
jgi:hypothetical protein